MVLLPDVEHVLLPPNKSLEIGPGFSVELPGGIISRGRFSSILPSLKGFLRTLFACRTALDGIFWEDLEVGVLESKTMLAQDTRSFEIREESRGMDSGVSQY